MESTSQAAQVQSVDIKYYLDVILSRLKIFTICTLVVVIAGVAVTMLKKPIYRATTKIEVNAGVRMPVAENAYKDKGGSDSYFYVQKQIQLLTGETLKDRVLKALSPEWKKKLSKRIFEDPVVKVQGGKTSVLEIWVDSPNKDYALAYVTVLIDEFAKLKMEQQGQGSRFALFSLTKQADELSRKISDVQNKMQQFRAENNDVLLEEKQDYMSAYLAKLNTKISDLKTERIIIERQIKALEENKDPALWISVIDTIQHGAVTPAISKEAQPQSQLIPQTSKDPNPNQGQGSQNKGASTNITVEQLPFVFVLEKEKNARWEGLKNRYEKLKSELTRVASVMRPEHPKRVQLEQDLSAIAAEMDLEVKSLLEKFKARREAIALEEQVLQDEAKHYQKTAITSLGQVSKFTVLKDEETRLKRLYELLTQRIEEINVSTDFGQETILPVETPRVEPLPPKIMRNLFISIVFGLGCGLALVFGLDYLDDSIRTTDDLKKYLGLAALGVVHSIAWGDPNYKSHALTETKDDHVNESYRTIRTNILLSRPAEALRTMLITSALPSEGKTTTAANTAIVLAQGGLRVLLIDADLRKPAAHKIFGFKNEKGLSSILLGSETMEGCIRKTQVKTLDVITAGPIVPDPARLFHFRAMKELLDQARTKYDRIIVDSAPVLTVVDSIVISDWVDGIICVVHGGKTSRMAMIKAKEALLDNVSKVVGVVINNLSFARVQHHYYYGYKYAYKYGYKYGYGREKGSLAPRIKKEPEREVQETVV